MLKVIQRPSDVRKLPSVGFTGTYMGESSGAGCITSPVSIALPSVSAIAHDATLINDTSITDVSPVHLRAYSAAAMPPAIVMPPIESPYAPPGCAINRGLSDGVAAQALPMRHQNVEPSYPPFSASGPRWPWPLPRT